MAKKKHRLLFVSSNHPEPSATAAAVASALAGDDWEITFASDAVREISGMAIEFLRNKGYRPPLGLPRAIDELKEERFDAVVTFCRKSLEMCPTFAGLPAQFHWPLDELLNCDNPNSPECFRTLFGQLKNRIAALFEHDTLNVVNHLRSNFGSLIDHLADGVMAHDAERTIFVYNRAAAEITGYDIDEVIGRDCHEVFPGLLCGGQCSFCHGGQADGSKLRYPSQFVDKQGRLRDLEMSAVTIESPGQNKPKGTLIIFRDLTEVNQLKRSLQSTQGFHGIVGQHESMLQVYRTIEEVADEQVPVVICGESGTGKELVAEALHGLSSRRDKPFVPVNCGALPEGVLESELFGHVKGAFTGAIANKRGRFELADGGTLFLDEIGEISPALQVKLLRVLEDQSFVPVGGETPIETDVRIVCATNRDLKAMTETGEFRDDLYYRLAVYPIVIPALRNRHSDILLLVEHILQNLTVETGRRSTGITSAVARILEQYDWPGNVRQLKNAIHFALIRCRGAIIEPSHLPPEIAEGATSDPGVSQLGRPQKLSREIVFDAVKRHGGSRARAARELGVARSTLYRYLR